MYVGRLAPSPTGALHLGNVRTFMIAWLRARKSGGKVVFRLEDLDHPRDKPGAGLQAVEDLRWLGFDWDEEYVQSERIGRYRSAVEKLVSRSAHDGGPLLYPCVCSRRDVEFAQSAPHVGDQLFYPGTCRGRFASWDEAVSWRQANVPGSVSPPCWRFRVPADATIAFDDIFAGRFRQDVSNTLGDFPVARHADGAGYTLAVVVDDAEMGVTEVVRGDDLLAATPAQILLQRVLGLPTPAYCHVPLVVGPDGRRLAKRHGDTRVASFRAAGVKPERIIGSLAWTCGWCRQDESVSLEDLIPRFDLASVPRQPVAVPPDLN